ncbi:hypothetical protein [Bacillus mobilis]|uniref:hypothetical protein n=1 Tax=Bacillus mobilis TaxID=2026190 RepID=UPI003CEAFCC2
MKDHNEVFERFWKGIVINDDGNLDIDKVKRELADYKNMADQVIRVYDTLAETRDILSNAELVIAAAHVLQKEYARDVYMQDIIELADIDGTIELSVLEEYFNKIDPHKQRTFICEDGCRRRLVIDNLNVLRRNVKEDIEEMYFLCPHCSAKYNVCYTNTQSRHNRIELEGLRGLMKKGYSAKIHNKIISRMEKLERQNKKIHSEIELKLRSDCNES